MPAVAVVLRALHQSLLQYGRGQDSALTSRHSRSAAHVSPKPFSGMQVPVVSSQKSLSRQSSRLGDRVSYAPQRVSYLTHLTVSPTSLPAIS
jgi:hypothetical protein